MAGCGMMDMRTTTRLFLIALTLVSVGCLSYAPPVVPVSTSQKGTAPKDLLDGPVSYDGLTGQTGCIHAPGILRCPLAENGKDLHEFTCARGTPVRFQGNASWENHAGLSPEFTFAFLHFNETIGHWQSVNGSYGMTTSPHSLRSDFSAFIGERIALYASDWYRMDPAGAGVLASPGTAFHVDGLLSCPHSNSATLAAPQT
jgi:hypothetical protein